MHIQEEVLSTQNLSEEKPIFERFKIVIIEIYKFQKMCIYMFDHSNTNNTSFE
jgi:hypothetical protein